MLVKVVLHDGGEKDSVGDEEGGCFYVETCSRAASFAHTKKVGEEECVNVSEFLHCLGRNI